MPGTTVVPWSGCRVSEGSPPSASRRQRKGPAHAAKGEIRVPPSKSVSHRYFNLSLLAGVETVIEHPLEAEDLALFSNALKQLGFEQSFEGDSLHLLPPESLSSEAEINCGNAGTMFRFLVATLTTLEGEWTVTGTPRLRQRPIGPLVNCLRALGAEIEYLGEEGYAPLRVRGHSLRGGSAEIDAGESSQYLSAVLMAACRARHEIDLRVLSLSSSPYLDLTLQALELFGAEIRHVDEDTFTVAPTRLRPPPRLDVEADFSSAAYPASAALLTGGEVLLRGLMESSKQGDRRFIDLLVRLGGVAEWTSEGLRMCGFLQHSVDVDLGDMPDQVPTLAALAPFLSGTTRIRNVAHLRIKESDRLAVMARELRRVGVSVEELDDGLVIDGTWHCDEPPSDEVHIDPEDDHRIAMSLALVGLRRPGIVIRDAHVVEKSYPHFWRDLHTLVGV